MEKDIIINEELRVSPPMEKRSKETYADFLTIDISHNDKIVFYKLWNGDCEQEIYPHTYVSHQYCDGRIHFVNVKRYISMTCDRCGLREELPLTIKTIKDLKKYFNKILMDDERCSRFEIMEFSL